MVLWSGIETGAPPRFAVPEEPHPAPPAVPTSSPCVGLCAGRGGKPAHLAVEPMCCEPRLSVERAAACYRVVSSPSSLSARGNIHFPRAVRGPRGRTAGEPDRERREAKVRRHTPHLLFGARKKAWSEIVVGVR